MLVEKIVWGHGLSAKNDEYQRQEKAKVAAQDSVVSDMHSVANQFNTVPAARTSERFVQCDGHHNHNYRAAASATPPRCLHRRHNNHRHHHSVHIRHHWLSFQPVQPLRLPSHYAT